jgi:hypothetical protein
VLSGSVVAPSPAGGSTPGAFLDPSPNDCTHLPRQCRARSDRVSSSSDFASRQEPATGSPPRRQCGSVHVGPVRSVMAIAAPPR